MTERRRVLVLIPDDRPDSNNEVFDPAGIELPTGTVPVSLNFSREFKHQVGDALLARGDDGRIYADVRLHDDFEVALARGLTPAVGGSTLEGVGTAPHVLKKVALTSIGLSVHKNADDRIPTLGENDSFKALFDPSATPKEGQESWNRVAEMMKALPPVQPCPDCDPTPEDKP
jgi:hypothetical protein